LVASDQPLPPPGDDFSLDADAFLEAMRTNPDHDLMVAFVPPESMRKDAREQWDKAIKNTPAREKHLVPLLKNLIAVLDGDWFYASLQLGKEPAFRVSGHFADAAKPKSLATSITKVIAELPKTAKVKPTDNATLKEVRTANARIQGELISLFRFTSKGVFLNCDLGLKELQAMAQKSLEFRDEPVDNSPNAIDPTSSR